MSDDDLGIDLLGLRVGRGVLWRAGGVIVDIDIASVACKVKMKHPRNLQ